MPPTGPIIRVQVSRCKLLKRKKLGMPDSSLPLPPLITPPPIAPPPIAPPPIPPLPSPDINMRVCSRNPGTRRVFSADSTSTRSSTARDNLRHRPSSYHYGTRQGDKFYNLHDPPPLEIVSQCISGFIRGTSTLVYILPEYGAFELINAVYHPGTGRNKATSSEFCELLAVAAIGSQYEDIEQETQFALFKSAKWYLDSGFTREDDVLRKMRVSMLVGLFFVFEKSFWARDYIDQAISLARKRGLHATQRHPDYSEREWAKWKRVWGSLVFLDGWLSGSLGSMPIICDGDDPIYTDGYRTCTNDLDAYLHAEVIKLSILMGSVTKDVYNPTIIDFNKVAVYSARLKSWHSSLPESLRLHRAVSGNDSGQRSTILLVHSCYLSCIILLTRRIFVERLEVGIDGSEGSDRFSRMMMVEEYSRMCVSAGRQLATVVGLLHSEGRIVRRCWMVIQAAYTAGLITLLCLSTGDNESSGTDPLDDQGQDLILKCIGALEVCAGYDLVAQRFLDNLHSIRRLLLLSIGSSYQQAGSKRRLDDDIPTDEGVNSPHLVASSQLTKYILGIFRHPFGGESNVILQDDYTLSKFFPQNWRFLVPEPPPADFMVPDHVDNFESISGTLSGGDGGSDERDPKKQRGPPHFRTKEEYEAFFRRIS